ncbi:MAG: hypothetical protein LC797_22870 [Chloroflexi bacterium]|nr:hypothetical protein [Chloroflexota bacterium]
MIVDNAWQFTSPYLLTLLSNMGGAFQRYSADEMAFSGRDAEFTIIINWAQVIRNPINTIGRGCASGSTR